MEAEGVDAEFPSEGETVEQFGQTGQLLSDEEEIIFSSQEIGSQENNNAIVEATDELEEGECSKDSENIAGVDDGQDKAKNAEGQVTLDQSAES